MEFLGHPMSYWIELDARMRQAPDGLGASKLLQEVIDLRGKLSYYEARIREMAKVATE